MGCTPSSQVKREVLRHESNLMEAYLKVEREICQEERNAPASALAYAVSKLEKITFDLEKIYTDVNQSDNFNYNQMVNKMYNMENEISVDIDNSIMSVMTELHIMNNPKLATEHEEFVANLNIRVLNYRQIYLLNRRKLEIEEETTKIGERVQNLQRLYEQQDTTLSEIFGSSYSSQTETELDSLRNYRDTLFNGVLAWQDAIKLTQSASALAQSGLNTWQSIYTTLSENSKFKMATETRNSIHEAALIIQFAQSLLPSVQFPYCTQREIFAILQIIKYLYTDMQIPERYEHTKEVYKSFHKRAHALSKWLQELTNSTILKDMEEVDSKITSVVSKLNSERIIQIKKKTSAISLASEIIQNSE